MMMQQLTTVWVDATTRGDAAVWCYLDLWGKAEKTLLLFGLHTENHLVSSPHSSLLGSLFSLKFCASIWEHFPLLEDMCFRVSRGASHRMCWLRFACLFAFPWNFSFCLHIWRTLGEIQRSCWIVFLFQQFKYVIALFCGFHGFWRKSQ